VDLAWRPYRPERLAAIEADVTFHERDAHVRQQITFPPPDGPAGKSPSAELSVPPGVKGPVEVGGPWRLVSRTRARLVVAPRGGAGRGPLVLDDDFPLPRRGPKEEDDRPVAVPLAWPIQATTARTKVRLWTPPGTLAAPADAGPGELTWKDRGT